MLKKHNEIIVFILFVSDILIISGSFFLSFFLRKEYFPLNRGVLMEESNLKIMLFFVSIWMIIFVITKVYHHKKGFSFLVELKKICRSSVIAFAFTFCILFFIGINNNEISRLFLIIFLMMSTFALSFYRYVFKRILRFSRQNGHYLKPVIIVGDNKLSQKIIEKVTQELWTGYQVIGYIDDGKFPDKNKKGNIKAGDNIIKHLGNIKDIDSIMETYNPDTVFIPFYLTKGSLFIRSIYTLSVRHSITIRVVPDIYSFDIFMNFRMEFVEDLPVITLKDHPIYGFNGLVKRAFDIVFSVSVLIFLFPLLVVIALLVKLSSKGPIFYSQKRVNLNKNVFKIIKFRTMPVNVESETGPKWTSKEENRATVIGSLLRKTSLDELPQFLNVLKGEMSVVGPRPERPEFIKQFREDINNYMSRHQMKAGITGWAQVNGWRGNTSLPKRLEYDIYYINNWSIGFDIKIIFLTILKGFFNKNAY